ncbi:MAG: GNAT family N-acetyltransferase [Myxococcota bacterium]
MGDQVFRVRPATLADVGGIARVHVESSDDAYAPLAAVWDAPDVAKRTADWREWLTAVQGNPQRVDLVAERAGEIIGFITVGRPRRKELGTELEVYVIHVLPEHRGAGVGARLWTEACDALRGDELRSMYVATLAELRCCSFYEARGGVLAEREPEDFHGGAVTSVVYTWATGQPCAAPPRDASRS